MLMKVKCTLVYIAVHQAMVDCDIHYGGLRFTAQSDVVFEIL